MKKAKTSTNNLLSYFLKLFKIKDLSVYQFSLILIVSSSLLAILITTTVQVKLEINSVQKEINLLKEKALEYQKGELKEVVSHLITYLKFTQQDTIENSQEQLKDKALRYFESIRFGNDGYVFVNTYNGNALLFNGKKLEEPKRMSDINLPSGINLYETEMNLAKLPGGGSFQYKFMKIDDTKPYPKMSYIMGFDQWGWILGAGDYLDNLDNDIVIMENELKNNLSKSLLIGIGIFIPIVMLFLFLSNYAAKLIQIQFDKFVNIIKNPPFKNNKQQPFDQIYIRELKSIGMDIMQAEELVQQFGNIIDQSTNEIYIFLKNNLQFVHANTGAMQNCGYSISELQNKTFLDILPNLNDEQFLTLAAPLIDEQTKKIQFESIYHRKNNTTYPVDIQLTLSNFNENEVYVAFIYDITARKKIEESLVNNKNYVQTIFDSSTDGIFIHDTETGKILDVNEQMCTMFGYEKSEVIGKTTQHFSANTAPYTEKEAIQYLLKSKTEGKQTFEWHCKHKDGHLFWGEVSIAYIKIDDEYRFLATTRDIDDRKKADLELKNYRFHLEFLVKERTKALEDGEGALLNLVDDLNMQTTALDNANKKLASINAEMETFTYSVSHDLKAPLRGIDGYSKLLLDLYKNELNEEAQEFLKNIRTGTLQMNHLIEDLLAYSRLERQEFEIRNIALQPLINDLLVLLSGEIKEFNIQIKTSFSEDFMLLADNNGLKLVLRNLLDNAIKFSSKGENPQIEIGSSENSTHWLIFVKDNGVGFDMKYHDRIFKIFQRLHLPEEYEGTGIGLAMVEKAMHRMNGRIWAESELNKGTCFYIEFKK
ncbi:PAS domain S-box protein [uncultured Lutibacter sp.]|uniref:PAS domain S-box protein n=1 Tax=uncultured Lutibacter sp. TaxID=437739 RepID=UPI0026022B70|nr:PAS domain S-box protein [uncultured Lutibacter sp.]